MCSAVIAFEWFRSTWLDLGFPITIVPFLERSRVTTFRESHTWGAGAAVTSEIACDNTSDTSVAGSEGSDTSISITRSSGLISDWLTSIVMVPLPGWSLVGRPGIFPTSGRFPVGILMWPLVEVEGVCITGIAVGWTKAEKSCKTGGLGNSLLLLQMVSMVIQNDSNQTKIERKPYPTALRV